MSGSIHGLLLVWLVWAAAFPAPERPQNLYEQEIKPFEKHIVWYNLRDKLPDVKPSTEKKDTQPQRARVKFPQTIVSGKRDDERPPQLIQTPAPAIQLPKPLPLPNVLAVAEPKPARIFMPPPIAKPPATATLLPEPPPVAAPRAVKPFIPPERRVPSPPSALKLPEAPAVPAPPKAQAVDLGAAAARPIKAFTPPPERRGPAATAAVALPEAPPVPIANPKVTLPVGTTTGPRRAFSVPAASVVRAQNMGADLAPPELAPSAPLQAAMPRIPRGFTPPTAAARANTTAGGNGSASASPIEAPPPIATPTPGATATMVIAGLNPADTTAIPEPPGSHDAGFSAGPKPRPAGAESTANASAAVTGPGLSTLGGARDNQPTLVSVLAAPTSKQNLLAALRASLPPPAAAPPEPSAPHAARVSSAPDPRLAGRYIYMIAIQMPNVSSFSGSWIVWFAEHQPEAGVPRDMRPPVPTHKVDPKYIASAVDEKVEGTVRLSAVIRKTGHVDTVQLLQHVDARLDRSAEEALAKWEFEPAQRDGRAVDVDAVFEIPFRLAPKPKR